MKVTLPESLTASGRYEEFAKGPGARQGRSNSLKWPWLYDKLRAKGYDKSKAAAISNSRIHLRKKGRISVLDAKAAHNPKVLSRLAESDRAGKHATKGKLLRGLSADTISFACHTKACAPPPVGAGGSKEGSVSLTQNQMRNMSTLSGGKVGGLQTSEAMPLVKKGLIESVSGKGMGAGNTKLWKATAEGKKIADRIESDPATKGRGYRLGAEKPATAPGGPSKVKFGSKEYDVVGETDTHYRVQNGSSVMKIPKSAVKPVESTTAFKPITAAQARGDSRPVSAAEFQKIAAHGQKQLDAMKANASPIKGLDDNWNSIKASAYGEAQKSWGGATINSHTGKAIPDGADQYALTVKGQRNQTVSVHENASQAEFNAAMDQAKETFRPILEREGHHLGVFHDDVNHRIDIDPVIVTPNRADVDTIGAASHSIGGAYNFKDGNGYWPPHVAEGA